MSRLLSSVLHRGQSDETDAVRQMEPESYVAIHPRELEDRLETLLVDGTKGLTHWKATKEQISEAIHQHVRAEFRQLLDQYTRFDPDADRNDVSSHPTSLQRQDRIVLELIDSIDSLLQQANYRRLTPRDISYAMRTASKWGMKLRIRFKDFHRLRVYARGEGLEQRTQREWYLMYSKRSVSIPVYRQMVVLFQTRSTASKESTSAPLSLRMFKNIPHADMDMLLPGSVKFSLLDQGKIGIPTVWGFAMLVSKLARSLWLLALLGAIKVLTSLTFIVAVLIAGLIYSCKLFFSYRHTQNRHLLNVTRSLYYQTLSNNSGVLLRLLDEAEQQLVCQVLLFMFVLERTDQGDARSMESLDQSCEALISQLGLGAINFDIENTLGFLTKQNIVSYAAPGWRFTTEKPH